MTYPNLLVTLAAAALVAWLATQVLARRAGRLGLLDDPNMERKFHAAATPVVGGLAVSAGAVIAWIISPEMAPPPGSLISFALILALGVADDRHDLHWTTRFAGQAIALLPMILIDGMVIRSLGELFGGDPLLLGPFAVPVTVFMGLGAINALNMIDGADGLAGGVGFTALLVIAALAAASGQGGLAQALMICAAALGGFLVFNVRNPWQPRARAFLGNAGSELLGLLLAWAVIRLTQSPGATVAPVLAPFLLGVPLIDCMSVMLRRILAGRSPFKADTEHLHHILQRAGMSVTGVAATATAGTLVFALAGLFAWSLGASHTALAGGLVVLLGAYATWQQWMSVRGRILGGGLRQSEFPHPAE